MNRFKDLREQRELTQTDLARKLNLSQQTISGYEKGNRFPDQETLERIADFFNVSIDYLLGRSDVRNPDENKVITKAFHSLDMDELPDEAIEEVEKYVELIKLKYKSDGSINNENK